MTLFYLMMKITGLIALIVLPLIIPKRKTKGKNKEVQLSNLTVNHHGELEYTSREKIPSV